MITAQMPFKHKGRGFFPLRLLHTTIQLLNCHFGHGYFYTEMQISHGEKATFFPDRGFCTLNKPINQSHGAEQMLHHNDNGRHWHLWFSAFRWGHVYRVHKRSPYECPPLVVFTLQVERFWTFRVHETFTMCLRRIHTDIPSGSLAESEVSFFLHSCCSFPAEVFSRLHHSNFLCRNQGLTSSTWSSISLHSELCKKCSSIFHWTIFTSVWHQQLSHVLHRCHYGRFPCKTFTGEYFTFSCHLFLKPSESSLGICSFQVKYP